MNSSLRRKANRLSSRFSERSEMSESLPEFLKHRLDQFQVRLIFLSFMVFYITLWNSSLRHMRCSKKPYNLDITWTRACSSSMSSRVCLTDQTQWRRCCGPRNHIVGTKKRRSFTWTDCLQSLRKLRLQHPPANALVLLQTFKNAELLRRQGFEKLDTRIGAKIVDLSICRFCRT